jgi:hypothetical protein
MDQDYIGLVGGEGLEPGADRALPGGAAEYRRKKIETSNRRAEHLDVFWMDDRLYNIDLWVFQEHDEALPDHRLATDRPELLGQIAAYARTPSSGDKDDCDTRHAIDAPWFRLGFSAFLLQREWISARGRRLSMNNFLQCSTCALCQNG